MKKYWLVFLLALSVFLNSGCLFIIGGAAGALGAYAISDDTVQGDSDKPYDALWNAAYNVGRIRGVIKQEDSARGYLKLEADSAQVQILFTRLTRATTRIRISARKHYLPNIELAQELFAKIMEEAR